MQSGINIAEFKTGGAVLFNNTVNNGAVGIGDTDHDFTALDQLMPHPVYAPQSWVCVLNPSDATFQKIQPLLAEAYDLAVSRYTRRENRSS